MDAYSPNYAEISIIEEEKCGVRFDEEFWYVYVNFNGVKIDYDIPFCTQEEAIKYMKNYVILFCNQPIFDLIAERIAKN